jgi:single-strand DNA-binding protein
MLNNAVIMGRLTADPELRQTPSNVSVTRFTVAVDRGYAKQGEEKKTDFINIVAWRSTAEFVCKYFSKGSMIAIQGAIETGSYEKDGVKRYTFEINADNVSFCGSKNEQSSNEGVANNATTTPDFAEMADDDDLPF